MGQHDVFGDGQAEAGASGFAGAGFVDAIETFEQAWKMLGSDAGAKILDEEFNGMRNSAGSKDDSSSGSPVLQSVIDQVRKDLMNGLAIRKHERKIRQWWILRWRIVQIRRPRILKAGILNDEVLDAQI